jgi:hypothetical protein
MNHSLKKLLALAVVLAMSLSAALAQAKTMTQGSIYVEPKVGLYANSNSRISSMFSYGAEAGVFVMDGLSIGVEALGYVVTQKRNPWWGGNGAYESVNAFGPMGFIRYYFVNEERFSAFAGLGIGGFFSSVPIPRNGYSSNLSEAAEIGFNAFLTDNLSMQISGRWQHIGPFSNQGADNWGGNLALKYVF